MYRHQRAPLRANSHPNKEEELHFGIVSYFHKTKLWLPSTFDLSSFCAYSGFYSRLLFSVTFLENTQ